MDEGAREKDPPGIVVQFLGDVVHHVVLRCLVSHGLAQFACYQSLGHGLLTVLPEEQRHLLPLHEDRPHHQLVEGKREVVDFRVVQVDVHFLLTFTCGLLATSADGHVILGGGQSKLVGGRRRTRSTCRFLLVRQISRVIWYQRYKLPSYQHMKNSQVTQTQTLMH